MTVLDRIASRQDRRDDVPNQELAKELAAANNTDGIKEIAGNLSNKDKNVQSDCIKVLYEIGYLKPELIKGYAEDFIKLLKSKNNRLVWGSMIALSTVAGLTADVIYSRLEDIYAAMSSGSVITLDNGIKVLALVASRKEEYGAAIFPYLMNHLASCRLKEVCQHAESILAAVHDGNKGEYLNILKKREESLTAAQLTRLKKIYKALQK